MKAASFFLSSSKFALMAADETMNFILPLLIYKSQGSVKESGTLFFLIYSGRWISYPFAGILADRFGARALYVFANILRSFTFFLACFLILQFKEILWPALLLLATLQGVLSGICNIAFETSVPQLCTREELPHAQAAVQGGDQLGFLLGPLLGGLLATLSHKILALGFIGLSYFMAGMTLALFLNPQNREKKSLHIQQLKGATVYADLVLGIKTIKRERALLLLVILTLFDNFLLAVHLSAQIPLTKGLFGQSEYLLSATLTLAGAISFLTSLFLAHLEDKKSSWWIWWTSYFVSYLGLFCVGLASSFWCYGLGLILVELSCATSIYALRLIKTELVPPHVLGRTYGVIYFIQQTTLPLGALVVRFSGTAASLQKTTLGLTAISLLITFILVPITLSARKNIPQKLIL